MDNVDNHIYLRSQNLDMVLDLKFKPQKMFSLKNSQENPFERFTNGALKFDGKWQLLSEFWRFPRFQDLYKLKLQAS